MSSSFLFNNFLFNDDHLYLSFNLYEQMTEMFIFYYAFFFFFIYILVK